MPLGASQMDPDCHTEGSQSEKDRYHVTVYVEPGQTAEMDLFTTQSRVTDAETKLMASKQGRQKGYAGRPERTHTHYCL